MIKIWNHKQGGCRRCGNIQHSDQLQRLNSWSNQDDHHDGLDSDDDSIHDDSLKRQNSLHFLSGVQYIKQKEHTYMGYICIVRLAICQMVQSMPPSTPTALKSTTSPRLPLMVRNLSRFYNQTNHFSNTFALKFLSCSG